MNTSRPVTHDFIWKTLAPMARLTSPVLTSTLYEDFEALEIAMSSGNSTLVFAMASYIADLHGLINGEEIAQAITSKFFEEEE